ncbi:MAG: hypothetical protein H7839_12560 [Magnetococcus sp. YQC-5]
MKIWRTLDETLHHHMTFCKYNTGQNGEELLESLRKSKINIAEDHRVAAYYGYDSQAPDKITKIFDFIEKHEYMLIAECRKSLQDHLHRSCQYMGYGCTDVRSLKKSIILPYIWPNLEINFKENSAINKDHGIFYFRLSFLDMTRLDKTEREEIFEQLRIANVPKREDLELHAEISKGVQDIRIINDVKIQMAKDIASLPEPPKTHEQTPIQMTPDEYRNHVADEVRKHGSQAKAAKVLGISQQRISEILKTKMSKGVNFS